MRSVRLVGALGIAFAFLFTTLAGGHDAPVVAAPSAPGQIALLDTYVVNPAGFLADGGTVVHDYGNGYLLVRLAPAMRAVSTSVRGVDWMPDRTTIDLWFSGVRFDTAGIEPALPDTLHVQTGDAYILQFVGPIDRSWVVGLEQSGVHFEQYLANFAFIVTGPADSIRAARSSPFVGWVGPYYAGYKVGTALLQRHGTVALSVIGFPEADPLTLAQAIANLGGVVASASFQPATVVAVVEAGRIASVARLPDVLSIQEYTTPMPMDRIAGQIHHYASGWDTSRSGLSSTLTGRSPGPDGTMYNGDDYFEGAGIADTGFDEGDPNAGALDFFSSPNGDRVVRFIDHTGASTPDGKCGTAHGTHVAGIIAGDGYSWERYLIENVGDTSVSTTDKDWSKSEAGVAPEGKISVDGSQAGNAFGCSTGLNFGVNGVGSYWDCEYLNGYTTVIITTGVSNAICGAPWIDDANVVTHNTAIDGGSRAWFAVNSNSWGSSVGPYGGTAGLADTRINNAPERLIVFAAGNNGPDLNSISNEALLKDGLSIGASDNYRPEQFESDNPNLLAGFSSRGGSLQSNGRIKPDLVAIGTSVISLMGRGEYLSTGYSPGADLIPTVDKYCSVAKAYCAAGDGYADYRYLQGTSMATPHAAGMALITREYLREIVAANNQASPFFNPPSYLVKAVMINGAVRMDPNLYTYPGYDQGWGRIDLEQSLFPPVPRTNQLAIGQFTATGTCDIGAGTCTGGAGNTVTGALNLNVAAADVPLKVTLVWLDAPGDALSRNLDLRVLSPSNAEYHGDQYTNGWSDPTLPGYDSVNNVEQVEVQAPEIGTWTVQIRGVNIPTTARFAIVVSADVGPTKQYKVDISTTYPTAVSLAPSGSATIPMTVRNFGTGADTVQLSHTAPSGLTVSFLPTNAVPLNSTESQDVLAVITASGGLTPGIYEFDVRAVSATDPSPTPASDFIPVRVAVLASALPYPIQVTNGTVDELDPSVLTFDDAVVGRHIFIAYRKTAKVSADGLTGGVNVWVAHALVDGTTGLPGPFTQTMVANTNEDPNDLRLLRFTAGNLRNRVIITWTGSDPAETNADAKSWARIAYLDPGGSAPYYSGLWTVAMIEKNEGTFSACNIARVSFPLFRAAAGIGVNGQLIYVWETLAYNTGCTGNPTAVVSSAKISTNGGSAGSWSAATQVFPPTGNPNFYFFPNGVVDQNDVAWIFAYWRTPTGNNRKLTVRLFDNVGWSTFPVNDYTILSVPDNAQWPAALSTAEGGNRVYVTFTRDNLQSDLKMYMIYATGTYSSSSIPHDYRDTGSPGTPCGPGCVLSSDFSLPTGSGLKGPYGQSVSSANYNRRPILNIVQTSDGIVWLPHMENANPYGTPNLWTRYSGDGFGTQSLTILTADSFAKGHQMSSTLTEGGQGRVYETYHSSRGTVTEVNYDVYLLVYFSNWPTAADTQGPLASSVAGTPNPVNKTGSFRLTANLNDLTTGKHNITAAEYFLDTAGAPGTGLTMSAEAQPFGVSPTLAVYKIIDVSGLGWNDNECHWIYVRGQDEIGNWGPTGSFQECTLRGNVDSTPPVAPVLVRVELSPGLHTDVIVTWNKAGDEGISGGTTKYRVFRQTGLGGAYVQMTEIAAANTATYTWTDTSAGDGDANVYLYRIRSVDAANNEAPSIAIGGKFTRGLTVGWQLLSVPVVQVDASIAKTFQTVSVSRVRTYVASDAADPWKAWIAVKGYNDLTSVDPANAYWAFVTVSHSFTVAGIIPSGLTITLQPGWNYVGFPSWRSQPYTVTNLKTAVPSITAVEGYANLGPYYLTRMADTDTLSQGSGYWVYSNTPNPVSWVVP